MEQAWQIINAEANNGAIIKFLGLCSFQILCRPKKPTATVKIGQNARIYG